MQYTIVSEASCHVMYMTNTLFQRWERECKCGENSRGVVQIFNDKIRPEKQIENHYGPPIELYIPLCLGALVSTKHILTSKYCFGREYERSVTKPGGTSDINVFSQKNPYTHQNKENTFENIIWKVIILTNNKRSPNYTRSSTNTILLSELTID